MCSAGSEARGFTLLELLVVLLIASLAVSLVGPGFQRLMPGLQLEAQARELVALLRHARSQAILSGKRVVISQDAASGGLRLSYSERLLVPPEGLTLSLESSADAAGADVPGGAQILFLPQGDSSGGMIGLKTKDGREELIKVDGLSGRVQRTSVEAEEKLKEEREARKAKLQKKMQNKQRLQPSKSLQKNNPQSSPQSNPQGTPSQGGFSNSPQSRGMGDEAL